MEAGIVLTIAGIAIALLALLLAAKTAHQSARLDTVHSLTRRTETLEGEFGGLELMRFTRRP
jgi:hypothetical protein